MAPAAATSSTSVTSPGRTSRRCRRWKPGTMCSTWAPGSHAASERSSNAGRPANSATRAPSSGRHPVAVADVSRFQSESGFEAQQLARRGVFCMGVGDQSYAFQPRMYHNSSSMKQAPRGRCPLAVLTSICRHSTLKMLEIPTGSTSYERCLAASVVGHGQLGISSCLAQRFSQPCQVLLDAGGSKPAARAE